MKSSHVTLSIILSVFMVLLSGCKAKETTSNTSSRATTPTLSNANATDNSKNQSAPASNSNRNADVTGNSAASDSAKPKGPRQLIGTYESREVHSVGVATVISKLRTIWMFSADGNY